MRGFILLTLRILFFGFGFILLVSFSLGQCVLDIRKIFVRRFPLVYEFWG